MLGDLYLDLYPILISYPDSKLSDLHPKGQGGIYIWICRTLYMLYIYICYRVFNMANGL